jgi:branched-subunit amino acid aminotransferase/4-amino-4-deoxychorismate lyase
MRAAARHGQPLKVEPVSRERLLEAEGVFLCNSLIEVWRVGEIEGRRWPDNGWVEKLRNWLDENN